MVQTWRGEKLIKNFQFSLWITNFPVRGKMLTNLMFMVRDSWHMILWGYKVKVCVEKWFHGVIFLSDYTTDNATNELRMKWTWHLSKLAVEDVSFYRRLKAVLLQLYKMEQSAILHEGLTWVSCSYDWNHGLNRHWKMGVIFCQHHHHDSSYQFFRLTIALLCLEQNKSWR